MSDIFQIFELHALKNSMAVVVGTSCPHAVRSSGYASVERPSVCPSMGSQQQSGSYEFAAVGLAGRRSISRYTAQSGQMRVVLHYQRT